MHTQETRKRLLTWFTLTEWAIAMSHLAMVTVFVVAECCS